MSRLNKGSRVRTIAEARAEMPSDRIAERVKARRAVVTAAAALLARIDDITTAEFQLGGERDEREALRAALERLAALEG